MRILITGCAGFIGYSLTKKVLELGHEVIGIDNLSEYEGIPSLKYKNIKELSDHSKFEFIKLDVVNDAFTSILKGKKLDITVHLAGRDLFYNDSDDLKYTPFLITNVIGTSKIFELANELGSKRFIYASTYSVYGQVKKQVLTEKKILPKPISPHGASKLAAEQIVYFMSNYFKIPSLILRMFTVYGPGMKTYTFIPLVIRKLLNNQPIDFSHSKYATRDFVFVDDVVNSIISGFKKRLKFQTINIASGDSYTMEEIALKIAKIMNKDKSLVQFNKHKKDFTKIVMKDAKANIDRARKVLDYQSNVGIDEGLEKTVKWFLDNQHLLEGIK